MTKRKNPRSSMTERAKAHFMYNKGVGPNEIAAQMGVTGRTVHRWLKQPAPRLAQSAEEWMAVAACRYTDPELWFAEKGEINKTRAARWICRTQCDVREQCLAFALANNENFGVWGGYSENERRDLKRSA